MPDLKSIALALVAAALSACGGGGGSATPSADNGGLAIPADLPNYAPPPPRNPKDYGIFAAPGLNLLPIRQIQATNDELAEMVAVAEYVLPSDNHSVLVRDVACHSFIKACNPDSLPFTLYNPREINDENRKNSVLLTNDLLDQILSTGTTKIVSISIEPNVLAVIEKYGATLPFVVIQSSGNDNDQRDLFFHSRIVNRETDEEKVIGIIYDPETDDAVHENGDLVSAVQLRMIRRIKSAVENDKVLYVSGYRRLRSGRVVREPRAVDCIGVENGCIYAPFEYKLPGSSTSVPGTSFSAPNVTMALASVLAYFPNTSGEDLIRLAKTCAVKRPDLAGLGVADFRCMTRLDASGEWRLVSDADFAQLKNANNADYVRPSPASIHSLGFPGNAEVAANFETAREGSRTVRLAAAKPSLFHATDFSAGVPQNAYSGETGLFPIAASADGTESIGGGIGFEGGFFAAAALGQSNNFYGLGSDFGYGTSNKFDVSLGHDSLFLRATYAASEGTGDLLKSAYGTAVGVSARHRMQLAPNIRLDASLHADRFAGGTADTAFGTVDIGQSPWNRHADLMMRFKSESGGTYMLGGRMGRNGGGEPKNKLVAGFNYSF